MNTSDLEQALWYVLWNGGGTPYKNLHEDEYELESEWNSFLSACDEDAQVMADDLIKKYKLEISKDPVTP